MRRMRGVAGGCVLLAAAMFGGCVSGKSLQDRHSMSRLYADGDTVVFEASVSPGYPADDEAAEAARHTWIAQWLARRSLCIDGYEVVDRVPIGSAADNPYHHDLRYTLRCAPAE